MRRSMLLAALAVALIAAPATGPALAAPGHVTYNVDAWPTQLFFDRTGKLRATVVGDSQDDAVEKIVQKLLAEK
jgi:hypothetical protein